MIKIHSLKELKKIQFNSENTFVLDGTMNCNEIYSFLKNLDDDIDITHYESSEYWCIKMQIPLFNTFLKFIRVYKKYEYRYIYFIFSNNIPLYLIITDLNMRIKHYDTHNRFYFFCDGDYYYVTETNELEKIDLSKYWLYNNCSYQFYTSYKEMKKEK